LDSDRDFAISFLAVPTFLFIHALVAGPASFIFGENKRFVMLYSFFFTFTDLLCYNLSLSLPCLGNWNFYWPYLHWCIYSPFSNMIIFWLPRLSSMSSTERWCQFASSFWCRCVNVLLTRPIWVVVMRMHVSQCALRLFISTIWI
jgi:hypothetical protein